MTAHPQNRPLGTRQFPVATFRPTRHMRRAIDAVGRLAAQADALDAAGSVDQAGAIRHLIASRWARFDVLARRSDARGRDLRTHDAPECEACGRRARAEVGLCDDGEARAYWIGGGGYCVLCGQCNRSAVLPSVLETGDVQRLAGPRGELP